MNLTNRKLEHFGDFLKQALGDAEEVLAGVSVNRNAEFGEPPEALVFVLDVADDILVLQFEHLPLRRVPLPAGPLDAEDFERLAAGMRARVRVWRAEEMEVESAKLGGKE